MVFTATITHCTTCCKRKVWKLGTLLSNMAILLPHYGIQVSDVLCNNAEFKRLLFTLRPLALLMALSGLSTLKTLRIFTTLIASLLEWQGIRTINMCWQQQQAPCFCMSLFHIAGDTGGGQCILTSGQMTPMQQLQPTNQVSWKDFYRKTPCVAPYHKRSPVISKKRSYCEDITKHTSHHNSMAIRLIQHLQINS